MVLVFQKVLAAERVVQDLRTQLQVNLMCENELASAPVVKQLSSFSTLLAEQGHLFKK